ncbi:MAG: cardiolipin synthase [Pseudomonadota bacterium]|nr:cardiolipin synthase [Pseudomonadota bacterium]
MFPYAAYRNRIQVFVATLCLVIAGCAALPDADPLIARHAGQQANFETAFGPLSERANARLLERLKSASGDLDILDRHIAVEEGISGSPLLLGNKATLLQDGPDTYDAMFAAIRAARDHVNVEFYIIEDDKVGRKLADILLERQAAGVQVNLIYDSFGCLGTPKEYFERLRAAGVRVLEFNPVNPLETRKEWLPNNRDHRKLVVVDGHTAFLGGINISSIYSASSLPGQGDETDGPWRDTHMKLEGPVVGELQKLFLDSWQRQEGEPLPERDYFPELQAKGDEIVRAIGSTPDDDFHQIYVTLLSALEHAEKQAYLTNAYFAPDPQFMQALIDAAQRGVDVRLILPSRSDSSLVFHAGRAKYGRLLKAGVRIFERQDVLLHAKTAVIDGVWSTVGSANLDWRSFADNDEVNAVIIGREFGMQMIDVFEADLVASHEIDPRRWKWRSPWNRVMELYASLWQRLL